MTSLGSLEAPAGYDSLVSTGMSVTGPVAIWTSAVGFAAMTARVDQPGFATFPKSVPDTAPPSALASYGPDGRLQVVVHVEKLALAFPFIDMLADGSFLVVGARCWWSESGPELNAVVYDREGQVLRRGCVGDGVEYVQVATDGTIWLGYFDEGVFGNFGWGNPGPTPLGQSGIVAWSPNLEKVWELDPERGLVSDCYALNVADGEVLSTPYVDFPIVSIRSGDVAVTPTQGIDSPRGILRSADHVGIIETSGSAQILVVGERPGASFVETQRWHLTAPNGDPLPKGDLHCRGSVAHLFADGHWLRFDLGTL